MHIKKHLIGITLLVLATGCASGSDSPAGGEGEMHDYTDRMPEQREVVRSSVEGQEEEASGKHWTERETPGLPPQNEEESTGNNPGNESETAESSEDDSPGDRKDVPTREEIRKRLEQQGALPSSREQNREANNEESATNEGEGKKDESPRENTPPSEHSSSAGDSENSRTTPSKTSSKQEPPEKILDMEIESLSSEEITRIWQDLGGEDAPVDQIARQLMSHRHEASEWFPEALHDPNVNRRLHAETVIGILGPDGFSEQILKGLRESPFPTHYLRLAGDLKIDGTLEVLEANKESLRSQAPYYYRRARVQAGDREQIPHLISTLVEDSASPGKRKDANRVLQEVTGLSYGPLLDASSTEEERIEKWKQWRSWWENQGYKIEWDDRRNRYIHRRDTGS